jgi:hypothetical protein
MDLLRCLQYFNIIFSIVSFLYLTIIIAQHDQKEGTHFISHGNDK